MNNALIALWQNKKIIGFIGMILSAAGAYLSGNEELSYGIILGYILPSPTPTVQKPAAK